MSLKSVDPIFYCEMRDGSMWRFTLSNRNFNEMERAMLAKGGATSPQEIMWAMSTDFRAKNAILISFQDWQDNLLPSCRSQRYRDFCAQIIPALVEEDGEDPNELKPVQPAENGSTLMPTGDSGSI